VYPILPIGKDLPAFEFVHLSGRMIEKRSLHISIAFSFFCNYDNLFSQEFNNSKAPAGTVLLKNAYKAL
jgi:hypothetical protein